MIMRKCSEMNERRNENVPVENKIVLGQ
jgi:hypothetical protein